MVVFAYGLKKTGLSIILKLGFNNIIVFTCSFKKIIIYAFLDPSFYHNW